MGDLLTAPIAAIDIGTNSVLLTVAECASDGSLRPLLERAEITRLGRGVDQTLRLSDEGIERTLKVLGDYTTQALAIGVPAAASIACVATSAARDAHNGAEFLRLVREQCGLAPTIIGGPREAELTFLAARHDFGAGEQPLGSIDIGGGSTEIAVDLDHANGFSTSLPIGSVRLYERCGLAAGENAAGRARVEHEIAKGLRGVPRGSPGTLVIGIAGTWTTLATLALELPRYDAARIHGHRLALAEIEALTERLWALSLPERLRLPGLQPGRADVIPVGALIATHTVRALGSTMVTVSDRGVRWGLLYERAAIQARRVG